ncbi:DUF4167 domain-containing protein [Caulobacter sp. NIBR1757]|uniref:DUF4167 domain-containing protein n=1 Tax=Caulobacter sp. NIBR1757 TaxID=3016000 RepID=UPI0022F08CD0|nr:DUF4167 domain-containing protein [Caulobacter sp. NIBR1757]WGM38039.1 hypothetical protein AMEJIAPC_00940 [Caulobacter sp. NIBR1757]
MRDFKGMKRQRGRNRNTGNKPQQHNANRAYDSNGPEGIKVRGAAQSVFEKYQQLARDATTGGDRVLAENYLQHAEHYFRLIRAIQPNRPVTDIIGRDVYSSGMDIDFEAEHEEPTEAQIAEATENKPEAEDGEERPRFENRQNQNRDRDDRPRDRDGYQGNRQNNQNRDRDDRPRDRDRWRDRDDRPRDGQQGGQQQARDDRPRDGNRDDRPRDDQPRESRFRDRDDRPRDRDRDQPREQAQQQPRDEAPREAQPREAQPREEREPRRSRYERDRPREERAEARETRDPLQVIEPQAAPLAAEPKRPSPRLRGQDGAVSELPGFLSRSAPAPAADAAEAPAKPKRRRAPKSFEGDAPKGDSED